MAVSKILHMGCAKSGFKAKYLANAISYITKDFKSENGLYVSGYNCLPETALNQMLNTKRRYNKMGGRQGYHIIISFEEAADTVDKDIAMEIIGKFVKEYLGKEFEAVYALHDDTDHIHGHIVFNSVRCVEQGLKYDYRNGDWDNIIQPLVNKICEEYHMATLDMDKVRENRKHKRDKTWDQSKDGIFVWNDMIRRDIDQVVAQAENWDEFLSGMEERGYEIKHGAHTLIKPPGMDKGRRLDTLKGDYTEEKIRERLCNPMREEDLPKPVLKLPPKIKKISGYIPRRKSELTGYQKIYFARLYRLGVIKKQPYSNAWKYKEDIRRLHELQEEYNFLSAYQIYTDHDLDNVLKVLAGQAKALRQEKRQLKDLEDANPEAFALWEQIQELSIEVSLYEEGYQEFKGEYQRSEQLKKQMSDLGISFSETVQLFQDSQGKIRRIDEVLAGVKRQQRIGKKILQEQKERLQSKKQHIDKGRGQPHYDL